ncbi:cysteine--tRNA ligase [Loigolactobacillus coryniformis]|jgi:cysteinyl-tRNA synthetase|uniref:Cysteine--tRNA ligase n=2 Tax=Loigolactobacillus coryniformis TaxID=1610 RepID=A0A0R1FAW6_9LACO|nr:cysteine--tRNA ligase [Loigolactobacillus coryniformis]RRG06700.1 MAG: cysteine--tRNA ligase [Lactobacillus sp.]ATO55082.1 cysteine--tRNA ligase [Loigolactobacillus coryniformis subsp. coryniformis KCTC 3167 = DSM 20001]KRK16434.1 cysteine--tRNA ligase [Loigolactobacillus coryniformis subsp. coryniformis KCTC 3167 = DSM 20001]MBW4802094.1 cysteine--tRNA ligase [Loigolactobacillus coryniformis subsp. torquens]MBW4804809.1 cysteine--tRNA ligase [Loigolactobacillus coryniformis subsp. torquens
MIQVYNTLTRKKEVFKPLVAGKVNMYVCGPTVYNYIHIGNARSAIAFDTIRRYFEFRGFKVTYVSNFTDVDDKMIKQAQRDGITVPELADKFIAAFEQDTTALNIEPATAHPRATENIPDIIDFIQVLLDKGYAYTAAGDVYYRARKFTHYGELSDQNIDQLEQGASEHTADEETQRKEDPIDFALWKAAKPGEIAWTAPWGEGRPGWHIECSVMATKYLGDTFDIHGGGQDLEFPHHENEIAQSEAKTGQKFANYWLHNGFVTIGDDDEKMSKSLGNFVTVHDLIQQVDPQTLRFFMATTQYRRPIRYSESTLSEAANNLQKLRIAYDNLSYRQKDVSAGIDTEVEQQLTKLTKAFTTAMDDDFNVQNGMTEIYELAKLMNIYSEQKIVREATLNHLMDSFTTWLQIFGVDFKPAGLLDDEIEQLIQERIDARTNKDYQRSDEIRDLLKAQGIVLEDTAQGTRWRRE